MTINLIVVALGGNALLRRGEPMSAEAQRTNVRRASTALAPLLSLGHRLVITHGNGPQVGLLALQAAAGPKDGVYPLDILGAESEGMIGYLIEQELRNVAPVDHQLATLLTQVLVDPHDPGFQKPTKPIGPVYDEATSRMLSANRGWSMGRDGNGWRRLVASPRPIRILEVPVIEMLVAQGVTVICAGGGGIPVVTRSDGGLAGVEAVIDKDLASALLARELDADHLLLLTDVGGVYVDWGETPARLVARASPGMLDPARFPPGSMGPKLQAANEFTAATGKPASIGRLEDAVLIVDGTAGTTIEPGGAPLVLRT